MPTRMLRDSFVTSESVASLPPDSQDRLPRYFLLADDFGCFQVHPAVIHGRIFPLRPDVTFTIIGDDLEAYATADIIRFYGGTDGKHFAYFPNWHLSQRAPRVSAKRKYPEPPNVVLYASVPMAESAGQSPPKPAEARLHQIVRLPQAQAQSSDPQSLISQAQPQSVPRAPAGIDPVLQVELHKALGRPLLEPNDEEWEGFVARTLAFPRAQCDAAAREFISRKHPPGSHSPVYVLRMIEKGAGLERNGTVQAIGPPPKTRWQEVGFDSEAAYHAKVCEIAEARGGTDEAYAEAVREVRGAR